MMVSILKKVAMLVLSVGVLIPMASAPAYAKDVCVHDDFGVLYVFKKVKSLKKPGAMSPLHGATRFGNAVYTVSGTAYHRADGVVRFGVFVHSASPVASMTPRTYTMTLEGDASYTASGAANYDGDNENESLITWTPVDCKSVTLP